MTSDASRGAAAAALPLSDEELEGIVRSMAKHDLATDQVAVADGELEGKSLTCQQAAALLSSIKLRLLQGSFVRNTLKNKLVDVPDELSSILNALTGPMRDDVEAILIGRRGNMPISPTNGSAGATGATASGARPHARSPKGKKTQGAPTNGGGYPGSPRIPAALPLSPTAPSGQPAALPSAPSGVRAPRLVPTMLPPSGIPAWLVEEAQCIRRLRDHVREGRVSVDVCEDLQEVFKYFELTKLQLPQEGGGYGTGYGVSKTATSPPARPLPSSPLSEVSAPATAPSDASTVAPGAQDRSGPRTATTGGESADEGHGEGNAEGAEAFVDVALQSGGIATDSVDLQDKGRESVASRQTPKAKDPKRIVVVKKKAKGKAKSSGSGKPRAQSAAGSEIEEDGGNVSECPHDKPSASGDEASH